MEEKRGPLSGDTSQCESVKKGHFFQAHKLLQCENPNSADKLVTANYCISHETDPEFGIIHIRLVLVLLPIKRYTEPVIV